MKKGLTDTVIRMGRRPSIHLPGYLKTPHAIALYLVALAIFPLVVQRSYIISVASLILYYAVLAVSLDLQLGLAGILNFGQIGFTAIGAYAVALLTLTVWPDWWGFWLSLLVGGVLAAILGVFVGMSTFRIKGDYFCIVSLGFGEIIRFIALNWLKVTRGPMGLPGIPPMRLFSHSLSSPANLYWFILLFAVLVILISLRMKNSYLGRAWIAIREDELAAESMGVNLVAYKCINVAISAFIAAVAGGFLAVYLNFIGPQSFGSGESMNLMCMVILGGSGTIWGAVAGAGILTVLPEVLRPIGNYRMLLYGIVMVLIVIFKPKGVLGK